jgi:hypothetical protein
VEKSPVSDSDAPMVIGVLELALELAVELLLVLVLLELLLHAAKTLTDSTAALRAKARLGSQGRLGLTPGSSFLSLSVLLDDVWAIQWCRARRARLRAR